ncbi:PREDICTED: kelch-like protein 3 [Priapulus caudatus]|uniref:Kelch-like protein 3 n=1 Tax=Priapulus caudatus TaxID=37621 RepID=A0ABM1EYZ4_PRICU|nr:PREDICTED: kelch-like protein 3 [Priapulus caudatus]
MFCESTKQLCDVVLLVSGVEVPAHKAVLASCSPYFYAMFTGELSESKAERIPIQGIDPKALSHLVDFVYTSEIHVTEENVQVLLPAANLLQLIEVRDACSEFLKAQLDPSNCLGIRAFADVHACTDLLQYAHQFTEQHFSRVKESRAFNSISSHQMVFEAVIAWIRYGAEHRQQHTAQLMEYVRLPLLPQDYLIQTVEDEPLIRTNPVCKDFLIEAMKFHLLKGEQKVMFQTPRTKPRTPVGLPKVMLVIGGQAPKAIKSVECYDFKEDKWYPVSDMLCRRCRAGVAVLNGQVYAVGGFNGNLRVRTVDAFAPGKDQWTSMQCSAMGLNSVESFDPGANEWKMVTPMSTRRSSVGVGVVNGLLYAVGGYDGVSRQCLPSVECYHPALNKWTHVVEMSARRSGAGVGVLDGLLYAVGGHDGPLVRKTVECFNTETNSWTPVADMSMCRRNAGVTAVDGLLYVVGGDDGSSNLTSVEVYDPKVDVWTLLPACMSIGRSYAGVVVIDKPSHLV